MSTEAAQILETIAPEATPPPELKADGLSTDASPPTPKPEDQKVSGRMEALIRREQAALNAERRAKAMQAEIESKMEQIKAFESAKTNPDEALKLLNFDHDDYIRTKLNDGEIPAEVRVKKVEEKFEKLLKETEQEKIRAEEARKLELQQREQESVEGFKSEIKQFLNDNNGRYEFILFDEQFDLVFDVIDTHYNRTIDPQTGVGKIMKISDAADKVEEWLEKKEVEKKKLKKSQALWGAVPKGVIEKTVKQETSTRQPPKTLNNQLSAAPTTPRTRPVTDQERVQRAIAYANSLKT